MVGSDDVVGYVYYAGLIGERAGSDLCRRCLIVVERCIARVKALRETTVDVEEVKP